MATVNGKDYNGNDFDSSTNPYGFGAGGHKEIVDTDPNYIQLATDIIADGTNSLQTTSTSSNSIGTGSKTFTMAAERPFLAGQNVRMIDNGDADNWMDGEVTSWTASTKVLIINVTRVSGSGTISDWTSTLSGAVGADGSITSTLYQQQQDVFVTSTGSANAYVLTPSSAISSYSTGMRFCFKANFANTGAATVNISAQGAKNIFYGGVALTGAEIQNDSIVDIVYDGTQFNIVSIINKQTGWIKLIDIGTPADQDYTALRSIPEGFDILNIKSESESGTCTATVKINTTALGGTANSVSSTPQTQAHSSSNTASADDDIVVTISSNSLCKNLVLWAEIQGDLV